MTTYHFVQEMPQLTFLYTTPENTQLAISERGSTIINVYHAARSMDA